MSSKRLNTPVLLIGFNRPDLFEKVLSRVLEVNPKRIYVGLDGARAGREDDKKNLDEIKKIVKNIKGCEVKINYQPKNLGCKYGPVAAMNWFFENEEMGIILEDDVLADKSFFYYCQELLDKYKDDNRVGSISGNNFQFGTKRGKGDYYFSRYSHSCGWATWRRAWKLYDIELSDYDEDRVNIFFNKFFDRIYWKLIFGGIKSKEINSAWDYQWNWMMWNNGMLGIIPNKNLVKNIGFNRPDATHTKFGSKFSEMETTAMKVPLKDPKKVEGNTDADDFSQKNNYVLWKEVGMNLIRKFNLVKKGFKLSD